MNILTVTLNPAIDESTWVDGVQPDKKLHCSLPVFEAGGGFNVPRVQRNLWEEVSADFPCRGYAGEM